MELYGQFEDHSAYYLVQESCDRVGAVGVRAARVYVAFYLVACVFVGGLSRAQVCAVACVAYSTVLCVLLFFVALALLGFRFSILCSEYSLAVDL